MDLRNCKLCGKLYQRINSSYCPACTREIDEMFAVVRDYIYDHPDVNVVEVSEETNVEEEFILEFLKKGRLELKNPSPDFVCEHCGTPITTGMYCKRCQSEFEREMKRGLNEADNRRVPKTYDSKRMHIFDYQNRRDRGR